MPNDEGDGMIGDLVEVGAGERVGAKRRLQDLLEFCRIKRRKVSGSVSETVGLAVELVDGTAVATTPGADLSSKQRIDELTQELSKTRVKVVLLTAEVDQLEGERGDTRCIHDEFVQKLCIDSKTLEGRIGAGRDGALSRYHGILRPVSRDRQSGG